MKSIADLAKKLHRQPWAVVKMLKTRGYIKRNGEPKAKTIAAGYMNSHGWIKKAGWDFFIDALGRKDSAKKKHRKVKLNSTS